MLMLGLEMQVLEVLGARLVCLKRGAEKIRRFSFVECWSEGQVKLGPSGVVLGVINPRNFERGPPSPAETKYWNKIDRLTVLKP